MGTCCQIQQTVENTSQIPTENKSDIETHLVQQTMIKQEKQQVESVLYHIQYIDVYKINEDYSIQIPSTLQSLFLSNLEITPNFYSVLKKEFEIYETVLKRFHLNGYKPKFSQMNVDIDSMINKYNNFMINLKHTNILE
eukprot:386117_1